MSETRERAGAVRHAFAVENFKSVIRNTLRGFSTVTLPSGMILSEVLVHVARTRRWTSLPSRPWLKQNAIVLDDKGKPKWQPLLDFSTHGVRSTSWSKQVLSAVRTVHPKAFEGVAEEDAA